MRVLPDIVKTVGEALRIVYVYVCPVLAVTGVNVPTVVVVVLGGVYEYELSVKLVIGTASAVTHVGEREHVKETRRVHK